MAERCQLENSIWDYRWPLGYARLLKRELMLLPDRFSSTVGLGKPSRFKEGEWVRAKDPEAIRATLDAHDALRGLWFTTNQWTYCSKTFRVERVVRRMLGGDRRMHTISGTVALSGVTCDGADGSPGCGRACSLLFRDDWLEPSSPDAAEPRSFECNVRVKSMEEIRATLDRRCRLGGVVFMPEMARFAGTRLGVVRRAGAGVELPWWRDLRDEWFILDGARCRGEIFGKAGPCHRNCGLLWHSSWLWTSRMPRPRARES